VPSFPVVGVTRDRLETYASSAPVPSWAHERNLIRPKALRTYPFG